MPSDNTEPTGGQPGGRAGEEFLEWPHCKLASEREREVGAPIKIIASPAAAAASLISHQLAALLSSSDSAKRLGTRHSDARKAQSESAARTGENKSKQAQIGCDERSLHGEGLT